MIKIKSKVAIKTFKKKEFYKKQLILIIKTDNRLTRIRSKITFLVVNIDC